MGQAISRRLAASFDKGLEKARQQMEKEMKSSIKANKYGFTDPNAAIGFTRGMDKMVPLTPEQEERIRQESEMSPELIKFLNDAGPIQRAVNKELTSPRLRESLETILESERTVTPKDDERIVRDMPLMGTAMDYVTKRTTNFSRESAVEEEDHTGLTAVQMYALLNPDKYSHEFWMGSAIQDEAAKIAHRKLVESCRMYIEVPAIYKDGNDFLGVPQSEIANANSLLEPATGVKLVLSVILDQQEKKNLNPE